MPHLNTRFSEDFTFLQAKALLPVLLHCTEARVGLIITMTMWQFGSKQDWQFFR
jgi:hypothetical protein